MKGIEELCFDSRIGAAKFDSPAYGDISNGENRIAEALERLSEDLRWSAGGRGPFGDLIAEGARVLIKPNFVLHENQGPWGMEPLVTHPSLIRAAVEAALRANPSEVLVGDAPLQSCDFEQLLRRTELDRWAEELMKSDPRFKGIRDFRRTTCTFDKGVRQATENRQPEDRFLLFDLAEESLLEPITDDGSSFRVTCYDPRLLSKTHAQGRHQYLIARDILEADVVINLPKLKTHKKAGITCALKNLIGINGNKEYLPHHRLGGSSTGGDCYPGGSRVKYALEYTLDRRNMSSSFMAGKIWSEAATTLTRLLQLAGDTIGIEGSWSGNDTIWRTCLDLNRILLYGRSDLTLADEPQRRVIHIVDAVVAGQGEGPLSPEPLPMGLILAGSNAAAVDWVGAQLLGYVPDQIPIIREAFNEFRWPLTSFSPDCINMLGDLGTGNAGEVLRLRKTPEQIIYPIGWRNAAQERN